MKFEIQEFTYNVKTGQNEIMAIVDQEALAALTHLNIVELLKKYSRSEEIPHE